MLSSFGLPPFDSCFGTSPSQIKNEGAKWGSNKARPPAFRYPPGNPRLNVPGSIPVSRSILTLQSF
jgi:hypothetical protein